MSNTDTDKIKLYPSWKQAMVDLDVTEWKPGQIITRELLDVAFGIETPKTVAEAARAHQMFRHSFYNFRTEVLRTHQLMLRPVAGVGYEVIEPQHQTDVAMRSRGAEVASALRKLSAELTYVRANELTAAQRSANADALAKVGQLVAMTKKQIGFDPFANMARPDSPDHDTAPDADGQD